MNDTKHVYRAITAVTLAMSREGLAKGRRNEQQGYRFRGIDDVYNALSSHLAAQKLCVLPRVVDRQVTERPTKSGGVSTYVVLTVEFDLVSSEDGSTHTIRTMGEAMDTADKATNKAMSAAMKYACLMAFQIPTEGDNDGDAHTIEKGSPPPRKAGPVELVGGALEPIMEGFVSRIQNAPDVHTLVKIHAEAQTDARLPAAAKEYIQQCCGLKRKKLEGKAA